MQFTKASNLKFEQINYKLLIEYESYLIEKGLKANSIANYMRTIRAIFNKSIKVGNTGIEHYPFKSYSIKHERTIAKVLSPTEFQKIIQLDLSKESPEYLSRQVFLLMFNLIGISFADLVTLKQENIIDGRIVYRRKKTKRIYSIKINEYAQLILDELKNSASDYLLPIFDKLAITSKQEKQTIKQKLKTCNKYLKRIGKLLDLPFPVSTYCSRYTWATTAKRLGYSNEIIAEALGHQYGNSVTSTYLDSFSQVVIDNANLAVIQHVFKQSQFSDSEIVFQN
jgi:integrase